VEKTGKIIGRKEEKGGTGKEGRKWG